MIHRNTSFGELVIKGIIVVIMLFVATVTLYPFWYIMVASFSDPLEVIRSGGLMLWFKGFDLYAYRQVFEHRLFLNSYRNTLVYLTFGLLVNMSLTTLGAYAFSRKKVKGRDLMMKIIVFTMFFSGGLIPTYLVVDGLKMTNTMWSQFVPYAVNTFNLIIMRTAFQAIPDSFEEAATIDGASAFQVMIRIIMPLALPSIMVIGLYYTEEIWNAYFRGLIYIRSDTKYSLQMVLRQILVSNSTTQQDQSFVNTNIGVTIKYATIMVSTVPVLMVYPFIQKYFVQGVMIGSIKG